eukprot:364356-Chlamydomonas_euryale.AAC.10
MSGPLAVALAGLPCFSVLRPGCTRVAVAAASGVQCGSAFGLSESLSHQHVDQWALQAGHICTLQRTPAAVRA